MSDLLADRAPDATADTGRPPVPIRTLVTHVDGDPASSARLETAVALARVHGAHLSVLAFGYDPNIAAYGMSGTAASMSAELAQVARAEAEARAHTARERLARAGVLGDVEPVLCTLNEMPRRLAAAARFADFALVERPYAADASQMAEEALEGLLFRSGTPIIVCPASIEEIEAERVLVAWDGGDEALRAVRDALPFLKAARSVEIAVIGDEPVMLAEAEQLSTMLSRHDIHAEIASHPTAGAPVADVLLRRVGEIGAGLLVMGGYGHSRLRERLLGGVTRDVLENLGVPALMAH